MSDAEQIKPKFLDKIENGYASENNPHRIGIFVRTTTRGFILTDRLGEFWETSKGNDRLSIIQPTHPVDIENSGVDIGKPVDGELQEKCADIQTTFLKVTDDEWEMAVGNREGLYGFVNAHLQAAVQEAEQRGYEAGCNEKTEETPHG